MLEGDKPNSSKLTALTHPFFSSLMGCTLTAIGVKIKSVLALRRTAYCVSYYSRHTLDRTEYRHAAATHYIHVKLTLPFATKNETQP